MAQIPSEMLAVVLAEAFAVVWLIFRMDKRLAVMETELKYLRRRLGMQHSGAADL